MAPELLGELIDRHTAALILYARQWCVAPEDVVQEAFIKLAGLAQAPARPVAWLHCVVRNGAISAGRSERRRLDQETEAAARASRWFVANGSAMHDAAAALAELPVE